jgi:transposase-like protein
MEKHMIVEKCATCNVTPEIEITDANLKRFFCGTCNKNHTAVLVKPAKEAAKKWNDAN